MKLALIALLASPAAAATLHPIQIEECHPAHISAGPVLVAGEPTHWRGVVERVTVCASPVLPENPYPYIAGLDLTSPEFSAPVASTPVKPSPVSSLLVASARTTGGAHALPSLAWVPPFYTHTHEPWKPEPVPSPVPLPGAALALLTALGLLWRVRK